MTYVRVNMNFLSLAIVKRRNGGQQAVAEAWPFIITYDIVGQIILQEIQNYLIFKPSLEITLQLKYEKIILPR